MPSLSATTAWLHTVRPPGAWNVAASSYGGQRGFSLGDVRRRELEKLLVFAAQWEYFSEVQQAGEEKRRVEHRPHSGAAMARRLRANLLDGSEKEVLALVLTMVRGRPRAEVTKLLHSRPTSGERKPST